MFSSSVVGAATGHVPLLGRLGQVRHRDRDPDQLSGELRAG